MMVRSQASMTDLDAGGQSFAAQKLWALSYQEWNGLSDDMKKYGNDYWLRSPTGSDIRAWGGRSGGGSYNGIVGETLGVRPAFDLNLQSVIFTSKNDVSGGKSEATAGSGWYNYAPTPARDLKFTFSDVYSASNTAGQKTPDLTLKSGMNFGFTNAKTGTNQYVSGLLHGTGLTDYYTKFAEAGTGSGNFIAPTGVANGTYMFDIFCEQANGVNQSDFMGKPVQFELTVSGGTATDLTLVSTDINFGLDGGKIGLKNGSNYAQTFTLGSTNAGETNTFNTPGNSTISGNLTGTGGLTKTGGGTLTLSGTDNYSGATNVNTGTLQLTETLQTTNTVQIQNGATLKSGMYKDGADWKSNLVTNSGGTVSFADGATWFGTGGEAGAVTTDVINFGDAAGKSNALAALKNGNAWQTFFAYGLADGGNASSGKLTYSQREYANVNDTTSTGLGLMVGANRVASGVSGHFRVFGTQNSGDFRGQSDRKARFGVQNAWVNWVGRSNEFDSSYLAAGGQKMKLQSNGVQLGTDLYNGTRSQFGVMFGYEDHVASLLSDRSTANDLYVGFYGLRKLWHHWDVRGVVSYGQQNYNLTRLGVVSGAFYRGKTNGNTFESMLELGRTVRMNQHFGFRPILGVDVFHNRIGGYDSVNNVVSADENLIYSDSSLTQAFARIGSDVNWKRNRFGINGGAYYAYQMSATGDYTSVSVIDPNTGVSGIARSSDLGRSLCTFSLGTTYALNRRETVNLFGNYFGDCYVGRSGTPFGHTYLAGLSAKF
ncbi:MAG: autotransporter outer membrane beta-barrel domain-containing protein [Thermoguttaceae bacterium]